MARRIPKSDRNNATPPDRLPETDPSANWDKPEPAADDPKGPWVRSPRRPDDIVANDPATGTGAQSSPPGEDQLSQGHVDQVDTSVPIQDHHRESEGRDAEPNGAPDPDKPADME